MNIQKFAQKKTKLVEQKTVKRVSKINLTDKKIRGDVKLHFVPDVNELPMLTAKSVYEVHQTEEYEYQDEKRVRYPTYIIPSSSNYNHVEGAVMPTEMQKQKLDKLCDLLAKYQKITNLYQEGGPKLKTADTKTQMWVKYISTYTKFWAKIADISPTTPDPKAKAIDTGKLLMVTHGSANFIKAFNKWTQTDPDLEISVDEQLEKINGAFSNEVTDAARCVKIHTEKAQIGFDVTYTNLAPEKTSVEITAEDLESATPLIQEDWDYTNFDDDKVDTLIERVSSYLEGYEDESDNEDEDDSDEESSGNPFDSDEE